MLLFRALPHNRTPWSLRLRTPRPYGPSRWHHPRLSCVLDSPAAGIKTRGSLLPLPALGPRSPHTRGTQRDRTDCGGPQRPPLSDPQADRQLRARPAPLLTPLCSPTLAHTHPQSTLIPTTTFLYTPYSQLRTLLRAPSDTPGRGAAPRASPAAPRRRGQPRSPPPAPPPLRDRGQPPPPARPGTAANGPSTSGCRGLRWLTVPLPPAVRFVYLPVDFITFPVRCFPLEPESVMRRVLPHSAHLAIHTARAADAFSGDRDPGLGKLMTKWLCTEPEGKAAEK